MKSHAMVVEIPDLWPDHIKRSEPKPPLEVDKYPPKPDKKNLRPSGASKDQRNQKCSIRRAPIEQDLAIEMVFKPRAT
ncbi:hypothetical protein QJS10_CPB13g01178 [Acorus calamus]|uniref:Uncharacterized protein n=1 Tax=Acorus calamus TaxID=4465 RepID=A0AAV9DHD3_ACOCL|nr:hypothetical protein QJS10_CPB13g01178 [Acorus calamus]